MRLRILTLPACLWAFLYLFNSCKHPSPPPPTYGNFPDSVGIIFTTKCAVTGCHDAAGAINSARLRLDTWDELFKGSSHGSVVIPFSADYSSLLYFINTDSSRGIVALPTMPYQKPPLSEAEYYTIKNWIANGAPDRNGQVAFSSNPDTRQKIYVTQQGCDLMAVIDGESHLIMRMFPIGGDINQTESPHAVRLSADGMSAFVGFATGAYVQKIDTRIDTVVQSVSMGDGRGGVLNINPSADKTLVADLTNNQLWNINFSTGGAQSIGPGLFKKPHGMTATPNWDTFYITAQYGNVVYRYTPGKVPPIINIPLDTAQPAVDVGQEQYSDPHEIIMTPDFSKFIVTCQYSDMVRVLDAHTYQVLAAFHVGRFPQELAISPSKHQVFVTCMEDAANPNPGRRGSVYVFDYKTLQQVGGPIYGDFFEPHGIAVDERNNTLYVVSANIDANGPPPHHVTRCSSRAGWYSVYDLNTLQPLNSIRYQSTAAPYSADTRFK